jgi:hypothetical protein
LFCDRRLAAKHAGNQPGEVVRTVEDVQRCPALADWNADKDFRDSISGRYVNKTGARELKLTVMIRYGA